MKVLIYGAGAVGQAVGGLLANGGAEVGMVLRPAAAEAIARDGLHVRGILGEHRVEPGRLRLATDVVQLGGQFDYAVVTVKSYDTAAAADALRAVDTGKFFVVSMQNGYGNVERLAEAFGTERVLCARVITGFAIPQPGTVDVTVHADAVTVGRFDGAVSAAADELAAGLSAAGLPARPSAAVQAELWAKIIYNCALNPLGAILGATYGQLAELAGTRALMGRIIDECYAVMEARGLPRLLATPEQFAEAFYSRMVPPTAAHRSSMLQDLRAGKRTEIDALSGAIERLAEDAGIATPTNSAVANMVRFLESRGTTTEPQRHRG